MNLFTLYLKRAFHKVQRCSDCTAHSRLRSSRKYSLAIGDTDHCPGRLDGNSASECGKLERLLDLFRLEFPSTNIGTVDSHEARNEVSCKCVASSRRILHLPRLTRRYGEDLALDAACAAAVVGRRRGENARGDTLSSARHDEPGNVRKLRDLAERLNDFWALERSDLLALLKRLEQISALSFVDDENV